MHQFSLVNELQLAGFRRPGDRFKRRPGQSPAACVAARGSGGPEPVRGRPAVRCGSCAEPIRLRYAARQSCEMARRAHHPSHRLGLIRLGSQFRLDAGQPVLQPRRLDRREAHAIHAWRAPVGAHQVIRMAQDVCAVDFVVEQVEPEVRLRLRLEIELPLKRPDLIGCCQAHHQSPILGSFESVPEVRVLPSAGITQPQQYYDPVRHPPGPPSCDDVEAATLARDGPPPITRHPSDMPCPLPRWTGTGASVGCFPVPRGPSPLFRRVGVHDFTFEACSGFTRVTACRIAQPPKGGLCHEASARPVTRPSRSSATRAYRQLPGWFLPPLVNRAVGAH